MSFENDFKGWMKEPEFEIAYWKTRFRIAERRVNQCEQWLRDVYYDRTQFEHDKDLHAFIGAWVEGEFGA